MSEGLLFGSASGGECQCCALDCSSLPGSITVVLSGFDLIGGCHETGDATWVEGSSVSIDGTYTLTGDSGSGWSLTQTGSYGSVMDYGFSDSDCAGSGGAVNLTVLSLSLTCGDGGLTLEFGIGPTDGQAFSGTGSITNPSSISLDSTDSAWITNGFATISWTS